MKNGKKVGTGRLSLFEMKLKVVGSDCLNSLCTDLTRVIGLWMFCMVSLSLIKKALNYSWSLLDFQTAFRVYTVTCDCIWTLNLEV